MRPAVIRRVQHEDIPRHHLRILFDDRFNTRPHAAEMHRHVRRIRDQVACRIEHGAGEIQPLLDRDARGSILQHRPHLLGNAHVEIVENLQHHRIGLRPHRMRLRPRRHPHQLHMIELGDPSPPPRLDQHHRMRLHQHRRPAHHIPRPQRLAPHEPRLDPPPAEPDRRHQGRLHLRLRPLRHGARRLAQIARLAHRLGLRRLDHQRRLARIEPEPRPVRLLEGRPHRIHLAEPDRQSGIGPLHLQEQRLPQHHPPRRHPLRLDLALRRRPQRIEQSRRRQPPLRRPAPPPAPRSASPEYPPAPSHKPRAKTPSDGSGTASSPAYPQWHTHAAPPPRQTPSGNSPRRHTPAAR